MTDDEKLKKALEYATEKHSGQLRISGIPYITHPIAVAEVVKDKGYGLDYRITGLFHDLLEDTDATEEEIEALGGADVLKAVKLLTKRKGYVMAEYVAGIKGNPTAYAVKAADRLHNLKCAFCTDDNFKRKLIRETIDWYLDFSPEIPTAVMKLAETLDQPFLPKAVEIPVAASHESFAVRGNICYSVSPSEIKTIEHGYIICENGKSLGAFETLPEKYKGISVEDFGDKLIIPGLVDLHIHAPQYAFRGTGMDMELMEWLQERAFPEEMKYSDLDYAENAYSIFAEQMKKSATTRACVFATRHHAATELLMEKLEQSGLISYVGKVNMDREAPASLCEPSADYSAADTLGWLNGSVMNLHRTKPILTPRFIPSCTEKLLEKLRKIRSEYNLPVQSHLSENHGEIAWVKEHCTYADFYGDVYDKYGLFGRDGSESLNTIMAHCVHSSDREVELMRRNGVFIAHCPNSNTNLLSGVAPIRKYLNAGLKVGLGSDVAGGHTESLFSAIVSAIQASKLRRSLTDEQLKPLTFAEAFYMATKGGGEFFGMVGGFEAGYEFDAIVLDDTLIPYPQPLELAERLERAAYLSLDLFGISAKYTEGKRLF